VYDIGFKVLSMTINYLSSFKHKHKHQTLVMKISYLTSLNRIEVMKFSMNISYLDISSVYDIGFKVLSMKINYLEIII
jgi:hypothetical protein